MHPDETLTLPTECRPTEQSPGHDSIRRAPRRSGRGLRRAFFGAVAFLTLSAGAAYANDLSTDPCTAGDVEIVGSGIVINEPCVCTPGGFFSARVQFTVRNNTSTGRYCIALHLVPDGSVLAVPTDLILEDANGSSTAPGKSGKENYHDTVMYADIPNFPCSQGMVCFGQAGVVRGKCTPGSCTTISWNTSPGAAGCASADQSPPGGQCRHQQVCVVGYGATLACVTNCTAICGTSSVLQACAIAPAARGPFTLTLAGSDGSSQSQSAYGDATGMVCLNFTVTALQSPTTTYTLTVTDRQGCSRTATASVSVTANTVTITPPTGPGCNGVLAYTAAVSGQSGCSFTWTVDGQALATFTAAGGADDARVARASGTGNNVLEFRALDGTCHTIAASANCSIGGAGACGATGSITAKECVTPTLGCTN
ncbi:MAG TPA: hypothetical protein VI504_05620 [Candidatus Eisenbacteria bacterium]|jgi:hypothetical protein